MLRLRIYAAIIAPPYVLGVWWLNQRGCLYRCLVEDATCVHQKVKDAYRQSYILFVLLARSYLQIYIQCNRSYTSPTLNKIYHLFLTKLSEHVFNGVENVCAHSITCGAPAALGREPLNGPTWTLMLENARKSVFFRIYNFDDYLTLRPTSVCARFASITHQIFMGEKNNFKRTLLRKIKHTICPIFFKSYELRGN
jgi:hypothetical protein